ncbi:MAG: Repeat family, partial [Verrucomicrobiales bacterium]|nr:Repeat family [Verrucomicrobiales bacterium]
PYPSIVQVSGMTATVYKVTISLNQLSHPSPADFDILLVGPQGQNVLLMSDAGGTAFINGVDLEFDDESLLTLPEFTGFASQTYRPTNHGDELDVFPQPAPSGPYGTKLDVFNRTNPNGAWSLYVVDDQMNDSIGLLGFGWSVHISTVDPFTDLMVSAAEPAGQAPVGTNFVYTWIVSNVGASAAEDVRFTNALPLGLTFVAANPSQGGCVNSNGLVLCSLGRLEVGGAASVALTGRANSLGAITNKAAVSCGTIEFVLSNNFAETVTTIKPTADLEILQMPSSSVAIGSNLLYTAVVSNGGPFEATGVHFVDQIDSRVDFISATASQGACGLIGGAVDCSLGTIPVGALVQITIATHPRVVGGIHDDLTVTGNDYDLNPANNQAQKAATVVVVQAPFANTAPITIPASGIASTYPSTIQVAGLTGALFRVSVVLSNLNHGRPADIDALLVGPHGEGVVLMSDAGGSNAISGVTLRFRDEAGPISETGPLANGDYKPTNYGLEPDIFPPPAPSVGYEANLSVFKNLNPNGTWSLYLVDDTAGFSGTLANGWSLELETISEVTDLGLLATVSPNPAGVGSNFTCTILVTNLGPAPATGIFFTNTLPAGNALVSLSSQQGSCNNAGGTIICNLGSLAPYQATAVSFTLNGGSPGFYTNVSSCLAKELDGYTKNNRLETVIELQVPPVVQINPQSLIVTNGSPATFAAQVSGQGILNLQWYRNGQVLAGATNASFTLASVQGADAGSYQLIVTSLVGRAASSVANLTVLNRPVISAVPNQIVDEDTLTSPIPFTVGDLETSAGLLSLAASSTDINLFPLQNIIVGGTGSNRFVRVLPATNQNGSATITLTVTDGDGISAATSFQVTVIPVNDLPFISAISNQTVNEDTSATIPFSVGDVETPASSLSLSVVTSDPLLFPTNGLVVSGAGSDRLLTLTPAANASGSALVKLSVTDGNGGITSVSFNLTVLPVNDAPSISDIPDQSTLEDTSLTASFTIGDVETFANNLTLTASSSNPTLIPASNIILSGGGSNRTVTILPATNQTGTASITITVADENGGAASDSFVVTVSPVNDAPTISSIANQVLDEDAVSAALAFTVGDVETASSNLTVTAASSNPVLLPAGSFTLGGVDSNRSVTIRPATNQFGNAIVTLTVNDGSGGTSTSAFLVSVLPINDIPLISAIPLQNVPEDGILGPISFTIGDVETPATNLVVSASSSNGSLIPSANIVLGGTSSNRTITITPATNQFGTANITITVQDLNGGTASSSFAVNVNAVNDPPSISTVPNVITEEDTVLMVPFVVSDLETAASNLTVTAISTNTALVPNSNLVLSGSGANRILAITPAPNVSGTTLITLSANDGSTNVTRSFVLNVTPVNDPPTLDPISDVVLNEDSPQNVSFTGISAGPNESQSLTLTAVSSNPSLLPNPSVSYTSPGSTGSCNLSPIANASGTAIVTITVNDGGSLNNIISQSFTVTVNPVNDAPTISAIGNQVISEDSTTTVSFTIGDLETPAGLLNVTATSTNTSLLPVTNIVVSGSGSNRTAILTPAESQTGTSLVTLTVNDGTANATATFLLTVTPVNDAPTLDPLPDIALVAGFANTAVPLTGISSGATNEFQTLSVSAVSSNTSVVTIVSTISYTSPNKTGTVTLARAGSSITGTAVIGVTVNDGGASNKLTTRVFTAYVRGSGNTPPVISGITNLIVSDDVASTAFPFTIGDAATPATLLTVKARSSNPQLLPDANILFGGSGSNRTVAFTPAFHQTGTATIYLSVVDTNFGLATTNFSLTVTQVNDLPVISSIAPQSVLEDTALGPIVFNVSDPDTSPASLSVSATSSNLVLVPNGNILLGGSGTNRALLITPATNQSGTTLITLTVSDGSGGSASTSFLFTVSPVNDAPTLSAIANQTLLEDTSSSAIAFTLGDVDNPATSLLVSASSSNPALLPVSNILLGGSGTNRTVTLTPLADQNGSATVTLTVSDGAGGTASNSFSVVVSPVNDSPTLDPIGNLSLNQGSLGQVVS